MQSKINLPTGVVGVIISLLLGVKLDCVSAKSLAALALR